MSNFKLLSLATASVLALAACGGGGGDAPPAKNVTLSGTAAKGILMGADVKVYALTNGVKGTTPLATTTTNDKGEYVLSLAPTSSPLLIEVTANGTTKMLDETGELTPDGEYPQVKAPEGLAMRSYAAEATQTTVVRINPLTEMAVAVASSAGGLTLNNLVAGQEVAKLAAPEGVNPFTQFPVAKPADMDDGQMKFAMQMAGLLKAAAGNNACTLKCQIESLSKDVKITVASDGKATVSSEINKVIQEKKLAVLSAGQNALQVNTESQAKKVNIAAAVVAAATQAVEEAKTADDVTTPNTETLTAANGLKGFVTALRNGFRLTETRLQKVEEDLTKRYENVTLDGVKFAGTVLDGVESDCQKQDNGSMRCQTTTASRFKWTGSGDTYSWTSKAADEMGITTSGTVIFSTLSGTDSFKLNGSVKKGDSTLLTMNDLSVSLRDEDVMDYKSVINGTVIANDTSRGSSMTVSLQLTDLNFASVPKTGENVYPQLADTRYKGTVTLQSSLGDKLTGSIDIKGTEVGTRVFPNGPQFNWYTYYEEFINSGVIDLKATTTTATANVAALKVNLTSSRNSYTQPESSSNYETYSGTVNLSLTDSLELSFNESAKTWDTFSQSATIKSGGSEVKLSMDYLSTNTTGSWCEWNVIKRCTNQIKLTSTNEKPYTATLTKDSNGKTKGDVMLGTIKVGEFANGVLKINGEEVSLY